MTVRRAIVVVPDLFFSTRIGAAAKALGVEVDEVDAARALDACRARPPDLVILDLHAPGDPLALARALGADHATRAVPIVGFYSHVDEALRKAAVEAGVDHVLPRSAFTVRLPALLAGHAPAGGA
ncbi:MAG TPA: hypothetical protein VGK89_10195 [Candidatus Eisenbacteria bacterium]